jgi:hypothetical protein
MHYFWYYCSTSLFRLCLHYFFYFYIQHMYSLYNNRIYVHCPRFVCRRLESSSLLMFVPVFAHVSLLVVHSSLDYPRVPLVPTAITPCALNLLYLFLRAVSSQSSAENEVVGQESTDQCPDMFSRIHECSLSLRAVMPLGEQEIIRTRCCTDPSCDRICVVACFPLSIVRRNNSKHHSLCLFKGSPHSQWNRSGWPGR